jgi:APA family basic amino acid/polyamine antiporter
MPVEQVATSSLVASDAIEIAWGRDGGNIIAALIVICTFGAINGNTMATSRVTYAMGKDRAFLPWAGKEHKTFQTPGNALWLHGVWTCLFIITGSFNMLADMFVFVTWVAYLAGAIGLMMLRKKTKDVERPYTVWGYPVVPILFILFSAFYLIVTIINDVQNYRAGTQPVINSLLGLLITFAGVPLYFYFKKKR